MKDKRADTDASKTWSKLLPGGGGEEEEEQEKGEGGGQDIAPLTTGPGLPSNPWAPCIALYIVRAEMTR